MLEEWEEFEAGPNKRDGERIYVSLNSKGQLLLNKNAVEALETPAAVVLMYEKRLSKIGIRPASPSLRNAFPLQPRPGVHSRMIYASPFCRNYGIKVTGTVCFNSIRVDNKRMMTLDLAKTSRVSRVTAR